MKGRLYTADEVFNAIHKATENVTDEAGIVFATVVVRVGADIAYEVAKILDFDMEQLEKYCKERLSDDNE